MEEINSALYLGLEASSGGSEELKPESETFLKHKIRCQSMQLLCSKQAKILSEKWRYFWSGGQDLNLRHSGFCMCA